MAKPVSPTYRGTWRFQSPNPSPLEAERRLKEIVEAWVGKGGDENYKKAFTSSLKAFMKTPAGKKLLDLLLSNKVLPLTLTAAGAGLAAILAQGKDFPVPPGIPVGGGMKVNFELKGSIRQVQGVVIGFSMPLGGSGRPAPPAKAGQAISLPAELARKIEREVPDNAISQWVIKQTRWEWETAGPDEEDEKLRSRNYAGKNAGDFSSRALAKGLALKILETARRRGSEVRVPLGHEPYWSTLADLRGLVGILQRIVATVARLLGAPSIGEVKMVTFVCPRKGGDDRLMPIRIP